MTTTHVPEKESANKQNWLVHNIKRLMVAKGLNEAKLARNTSIPQPTLHKILAAKTSDPRISTLRAIAEFFNISLDSMIYTPPHEPFDLSVNGAKRTTKHIPIISWEQCIDAGNILVTLTHNNWDHWQIATVKSDQVVLLATKASMEPKFPKGTLLTVDLNATPADGDLVIVHYPNTEEATLRQLALDGPIKRLKTLGHEQDSDVLNDKIGLLGVVTKASIVFHKD